MGRRFNLHNAMIDLKMARDKMFSAMGQLTQEEQLANYREIAYDIDNQIKVLYQSLNRELEKEFEKKYRAEAGL